MFEYNARTEVINGAKFIEKDVILFDYSYSGDILLQVDANLISSGFGFVIVEDENNENMATANKYLIKINSNDSYHIFYKTGNDQRVLDHGFFVSATKVYSEKDVILFLRKNGDKLLINKAIRNEDGIYQEIPLISYVMSYDMENYKIGIYSNGGNTVKFASISTEAPSNWITNIFNANGGRIKWIKNGFQIDEADYDIEVEAENIWLKAGTYWFDYTTNNPEIKAYVFESYRKPTDEKRSLEEINNTRVDELKNILQDDKSFTLQEDHAVNIRFRGKTGTVKNICIKKNKEDEFVETKYGSVYRDPSRITFDLTKIKEIKIKAIIESVPEQDLDKPWVYHIFKRGEDVVPMGLMINNKENYYTFVTSTGKLTINGEPLATLLTGNTLSAFYNVNARILELIIITKTGEEVNVLLQKTFHKTINGEITSPIIVTIKNDEPLELSSAYRKSIKTEVRTERFHAYNPIKLKYDVVLSDPRIKIYGVKANSDNKTLIEYQPSQREIMNKTIKIPSEIKLKYYWVFVEYNAIVDTKYIFTPWEREVFDLEKDSKMYLSKTVLRDPGNIKVYGIKDKDFVNERLIYYIPGDSLINSVDLCCSEYNIIPESQFRLTSLNKLVPDIEAIQEFKYLIVDYLKLDSYAVNHKKDYWEIEVSSTSNDYKIYYDSEDGLVTSEFQALSIPNMKTENDIEEDDFIVLEAGL